MQSFRLVLLLLSTYVSISIATLLELTPDNVKKAASDGIWFIEYFSPYSSQSNAFAPTWEKLASDFESVTTERNFYFGKIDCVSFNDLCLEHKVDLLPTIQMFEHGELKEIYSGPRNYEEVAAFLNEKFISSTNFDEQSSTLSKFEPLEDIGSGSVADAEGIFQESPNPRGVSVRLDGKKLDQIIKSREYWFIKFYSPSCPHCIALAPTWTRMASELRNQVNVAEVNCEALPSVCRQNGIPYYPLLRMYGRRSPIEYHGDRSLESLVHFAKSNSRPFLKEASINDVNERYPPVSRLNLNEYDEILDGNHKLVIRIVDEENSTDQSKFHELASHWIELTTNEESKYENSILFAEIERFQWMHYIYSKYEAVQEINSQIIIYDALKSEYYITDQENQLLSMDKPEKVYSALENLDSLNGIPIALTNEAINIPLKNNYSIFSLHGFLFVSAFITVALIIQKHFTVPVPFKRKEILPSYQAITSNPL